MAWLVASWLPLSLLILPFIPLIYTRLKAPRGPAQLLLLLPALWAAPLLICLLVFNRRGFESVNTALLAICCVGWVGQLAIAAYVGWRARGARWLAAGSLLVNTPATFAAVIGLAQGASGVSL